MKATPSEVKLEADSVILASLVSHFMSLDFDEHEDDYFPIGTTDGTKPLAAVSVNKERVSQRIRSRCRFNQL